MQLVVPSAVSAAVSAVIDDLAVGLCHLLAILAHLAGDHLLFYFLNLNCSHSFSFFFLRLILKIGSLVQGSDCGALCRCPDGL